MNRIMLVIDGKKLDPKMRHRIFTYGIEHNLTVGASLCQIVKKFAYTINPKKAYCKNRTVVNISKD